MVKLVVVVNNLYKKYRETGGLKLRGIIYNKYK